MASRPSPAATAEFTALLLASGYPPREEWIDRMCLAVPGRVIEIAHIDGLRMGKVDFGGVSRSVCLDHVDAEPGDYVLVHVGFALSKLSAPEADELSRMLREIAGTDAEEFTQ